MKHLQFLIASLIALAPAPVQQERQKTESSVEPRWEGALEHSFGTVLSGTKLKHKFVLGNSSGDLRRIQRIKPDCSCTTAAPLVIRRGSEVRTEYSAEHPIGPGDRVEIECTLDTSLKSGTLAVPVWFECEGDAPLRLTLRAEAVPLFTLEPPTLALGNVVLGAEAGGRLTISSPVYPSLRVELGSDLPEGVACALSPVAPDLDGFAASWILDARLTTLTRTDGGKLILPISLSGEGKGQARFPEAADSGRSSFRAFVEAQLVQPVYAEPAFVSFGSVPQGDGAVGSFTVHTTLETPLRIAPESLRVSGTLAGEDLEQYLRFEIRPLGSDTEIVVRLVDPPAELVGGFRGEISISIDHPRLERIAVPVFGLVRAGRPAEIH